MTRAAASLALMVLLAACADRAATHYSTETLPNGATQVTNHAPSGWADSAGIALVLERSILPEEGSQGELSLPLGLAVLDDGRIVVNDGPGGGILLFNTDGSFDRKVGRHGDGPGEYGEMFELGAVRHYVAIHECNKARVTIFNVATDSSHQWRSVDCMSGSDLRISPEGALWLGDRVRDSSTATSSPVLVQWGNRGEPLDTFRLPPWREPAILTAGNAAIPIPYSPHSHDAGTPPLIWSGQGDALEFSLVNGTGDTVRVATIPGSAAPLPDSLRQAVVDRFARSQRFAGIAKLEDIPTVHPLFSDMSVDDQGRLWVHRPAVDGTVGHFDVLDHNGIWLGTVRAPGGSARAMHWANDRYYRVVENEEGRPVIEVYRIVTSAT